MSNYGLSLGYCSRGLLFGLGLAYITIHSWLLAPFAAWVSRGRRETVVRPASLTVLNQSISQSPKDSMTDEIITASRVRRRSTEGLTSLACLTRQRAQSLDQILNGRLKMRDLKMTDKVSEPRQNGLQNGGWLSALLQISNCILWVFLSELINVYCTMSRNKKITIWLYNIIRIYNIN